MRAALNTARSATGYGIEAGRNAIEDTRNGIEDVIVPIYILGVLLPIPVGWMGDFIGLGFSLVGWELTNRLSGFFYHLGHVPAALAMVFVGYYYWQIVGRGMAAETMVHVLPNWLQSRVAQWSVGPGVMPRNFRLMATIGMWGQVFLWVPIEFPVWRHLYHYLAAMALTMALTYVVATSKHFDTFWRKFYGGNLAFIALRHGLGLVGIEILALWTYVTTTNSSSVSFKFDETTLFLLMGFLLVGGLGFLYVTKD